MPTRLWSTSAQELAPLFLGLGEQRLLHISGLKRYSLSGKAIRTLKPPQSDPFQLLIKGVELGSSDLWIWKTDGTIQKRKIQVEKNTELKLSPELKQILTELTQCEVFFTPKAILIRGTIQSFDELVKVSALTQMSGEKVIDETLVDPDLLHQGFQTLQDWIKQEGLNEQLYVEITGGEILVRGLYQTPEEQSLFERQIRARYPRAILDLKGKKDHAPTIFIRIFLLELRKIAQGALGVRWPEITTPDSLLLTPVKLKSNIELELAIQALEGEGHLRVLSNPELVVRAPGEAELFAGGELPIRNFLFSASSPYQQSNVDWKRIGLSLKLNVTEADPRRVRLDVLTEVSHINPIQQNTELPGLQTNRLKTQVDAQFGVPLLLSGLLQENMRKQARGLPILKDLPLLGALFGSEDYLNDRSELVAILLPHAAPPPNSIKKIDPNFPKGALPPPRNWLSFEEEKNLKNSPEYPWNVF